jgi:hypothetical protein
MQRRPDNAYRWVRLEDIRRYVCHGVPREEDGWAREDEELTMRWEEEEDDAELRERRGGTAMGEPHAWHCQEELAPGEGLWCKTQGNSERGGQAGAMMMLAFETLSRILSSAKTFL